MAFLGKWAFVKNEKMREFVIAAGAPEENVNKMIDVDITVECTRDGDYYQMSFIGPKKTVVQKFKPGEQFKEEIGPFGKHRQAIATFEGGNKLIIKGVNEGEAVETREINGDEMTFTFTKPGIAFVAKRFFKRA
ncbi:fatty acid-binding protein, liver-like [Saccoglossus kowalevskii]|uniref:Fatty acid-binding protein 10-A, liver basic-like n=1 Tax=Saccoglossus kowalevskii TaxID=10224 RepID=A0ABM0MRK6_SACKO|nr:PREDICTED: fatty acid-binding protein 10-A, liver basic-like [Saccoglossus kowalevskii]XP_006822647.1 PREDICTED: fatty acid-binding protein 10-A, liver basic-like [Saccoglossus kowalevskii]